ncbi:MAG: PqqD family protein, partial [Desulfobacterales bacterium]
VGDMNCIYNLNEVGAYIWQNIKCKNSVADLKDMILSEFDVTESQAEADLEEYLKDLTEIEAIFPTNSCPNCNCS